MSGKALRVLNSLPGPENRNESPGKGNLKKAYVENSSENFDKLATENPASLNPTPVINSEVGSTGGDVGNSEVEYIESENLHDVEDDDTSLSTLLARLDSKNWVLVCEALNHVRQLSIFHKEALLEMLGNVISLIVKSLKSPRSAVCKTAIMTSADIFRVYSDHIVDSFDPLLVQLLLKSSQDKRFVCEAAERALVTMTTWVSPNLLLPKLQPHLKHKNPRIRAKASMCFCRSVPRLGTEGINAYGIDKLIQVAASQLSDQLPESREAARTLALELQTVYEKSHITETTEKSHITETTESQSGYITEITESQSGNLVIDSWEDFCQAKLSPLSAQAILRVTSVAREGLVVGC